MVRSLANRLKQKPVAIDRSEQDVLFARRLYANPAIRRLIREDCLYQLPNLMQVSGTQQMSSMEKAVGKLLERGEITAEQVVPW